MKPVKEPKKRKRGTVYQYYRAWMELVEIRKHHTSRLTAIEAGKSKLDPELEKNIMASIQIEEKLALYQGLMIETAKLTAPEIFSWMTSIKGIGDSLAAQLIANIDDIGAFATVSKLWRFAGFSVKDGKREHNVKGEESHYSNRLKTTCYLIGEQFLRHYTPGYRNYYDEERLRQRELHPQVIKVNGKTMFNDGHLHYRAMGRMIKIFLQHVWNNWRVSEGLPVTLPYPQGILGHSNYIEPPKGINHV